MDHVAYMKKSWNFIGKILAGEKKIESRWYQAKRSPWKNIAAGDTIYFKNSGEAVELRAAVWKVVFISDLTPSKVKEILLRHGKDIGIKDLSPFYRKFKDKKYCILLFLKKPELIKPFQIDKRGFGAMAAWISVPYISKIRIY